MFEPRFPVGLAFARRLIDLHPGRSRPRDIEHPMHDVAPPLKMITLARRWPRSAWVPCASEIGAITLVDEASIDDDEIVRSEDPVCRGDGKGHVTVKRRRSLRNRGRRDLPDGVHRVGNTAELEHPPKKSTGQLALANPGPKGCQYVVHGNFVARLRLSDASDLIGALHKLGWSEHEACIHQCHRRQLATQRSETGSGEVVKTHTNRSAAEKLPELPNELLSPFWELNKKGTAYEGSGYLGWDSLRVRGEDSDLVRGNDHHRRLGHGVGRV